MSRVVIDKETGVEMLLFPEMPHVDTKTLPQLALDFIVLEGKLNDLQWEHERLKHDYRKIKGRFRELRRGCYKRYRSLNR